MSTDQALPDVPEEEPAEEPFPEISYDQQRYAARPERLRPKAKRKLAGTDTSPLSPPFTPDGRNPAYVDWLERQSMLRDATVLGRQLAGHHSMWASPFAHPDPRAAVHHASVWFTAYPLSVVTAPGQSLPGRALGDQDLWAGVRRQIGIDAVHTGPLKLAGGISGWEPTPSVDGHFDRISMQIDPAFGTEDEFRDDVRRRPRAATARSSTTSSPVTPARAPTSGSPS